MPKIIRMREGSRLMWQCKKPGKSGGMYAMAPGLYGLKVPGGSDQIIFHQNGEGMVSAAAALFAIRETSPTPLLWGCGGLPCRNAAGEGAVAGAYGIFTFRVVSPQVLYEKISDLGSEVSLDAFRRRVVPMIGSRLQQVFVGRNVPASEIAEVIQGPQAREGLDALFGEFGLGLENFEVHNYAIREDA